MALTASKPDGAGVMAVLRNGASEATFDLDLPDGAELENVPDGSILVTTPGGEDDVTISAVIRRPWAKDATGKAIPTRYEILGNTLVQKVDTEDAQYPIVADPWITGYGLYRTVGVIYVQWSKTATRNLAGSAAVGVAAAAGSACNSIPHAVGKALCVGTVGWKLSDFQFNVTAAKNEGKCLKARVPVQGIPGDPNMIMALDFYRKTC